MNKKTDILNQESRAGSLISNRLAGFAVWLEHDAIPPEIRTRATDRPLSNAEIVTKYRANSALWAGPTKVAAMRTSLLVLDDSPSAADAFALFRGA